jgi:type IV secretory pathway ATPase VirB11/archaellum biosynthesis ATPase
VDIRLDPPSVHFRTIESLNAEPMTELRGNASHRAMDANQIRDALRSALRRNPDVIIIGECNDPESIRLAREAADTGFVLSLQDTSLLA